MPVFMVNLEVPQDSRNRWMKKLKTKSQKQTARQTNKLKIDKLNNQSNTQGSGHSRDWGEFDLNNLIPTLQRGCFYEIQTYDVRGTKE